ncbi:hypothetical protein K4A83_05345 [Spirulina subsalsa FACHB-351]|uniref:Uncharacterized protein n=1 Tax=Spirulina subsalsa FACHB-351 TaxID=234711 RepID=A0ABT3L3D1_9CYAN|nr:hypothetical protein [Spirulina subsalsa]MCW6035697.1 hypothetical protein [Spirulina subsalsa FACHB-351]
MTHIEIKTRQFIGSDIANKIVKKGTVSAVLTTGKIYKPAKDIFDQAGIAWAENIDERQFLKSEAQEVK